MLQYSVYDVFTDRPFAGNQLAVIDAADGLDDAQMLAIAREFGFSESVFVQSARPATVGPPATARVRIFTMRGEIPFAGHPTIGTAIHLATSDRVERGAEVILDEGVGAVRRSSMSRRMSRRGSSCVLASGGALS